MLDQIVDYEQEKMFGPSMTVTMATGRRAERKTGLNRVPWHTSHEEKSFSKQTG